MLHNIIHRMQFINGLKDVDNVEVIFAIDVIDGQEAHSLKHIMEQSFYGMLCEYRTTHPELFENVSLDSFTICYPMAHVEITENYKESLGVTMLGECEYIRNDEPVKRYFRMAFEFIGDIVMAGESIIMPLVTYRVSTGLDVRNDNEEG